LLKKREKAKEISRVVISDTATATAVPSPSITPQLMLPRDYTKAPECYTEAPQHYTTKALEYYTTTYHGKYSVMWSFNMASTKYTNYLLLVV
jgi:hypothetical protein